MKTAEAILLEHLKSEILEIISEDYKEKILAAKRANIKEIILSKSNQKDINEIKADYTKDLKFHYVADMKEVINMALLSEKVSNALDLTVKEDLNPVMN